ncbi:MAG: DUF4837 family protein [Rikenellaceae bacterium]
MKKILFPILILLALVGCKGGGEKKFIKASSGNPYEMFAVMTQGLWDGAVGDTIKSTFTKNVEMINFDEPAFDVLYLVPDGFKGLALEHRNVLIARFGSQYPKAEIIAERNKHAQPQLYVFMQAPTQQELTVLVDQKIDSVRGIFDKDEISRFAAKVSQKGSVAVQDSIKKMFGFTMAVPSGTKIRNIEKKSSFLWSSYEMPESSQGLIVYSYPYTGEPFTSENIVKERNKFVSLVPGALKNSHMSTSDYAEPLVVERNINGRTWYETRGFWRVEGDFMGGPFVSFSTIDTKNNRVLVIDGYVYSPNPSKGQRNYIKQLESLVNTIKI